jgi:broad specificity phosphatase PhoE
MRTTVHLVRHGKVENPKGVIYGRMPGFNLSELGLEQAGEAKDLLSGADVAAVWASPLERAQETAAIIAEPHGLSVVTDERLVESGTTLEGLGRTVAAFVRSPRHWWRLRNPFGPSWGEQFSDIRRRMLAAIDDAMELGAGRDVVLVSHQTPVVVARMALAKQNAPPWMGLARSPCATGSVTSLVVEAGRVVESTYFEPSS